MTVPVPTTCIENKKDGNWKVNMEMKHEHCKSKGKLEMENNKCASCWHGHPVIE